MPGVMVNAWLDPYPTQTVPDGEIIPPGPAEAAIQFVFIAKFAITERAPSITTVIVLPLVMQPLVVPLQ